MRTTVSIDDEVLAAAKRRARERDQTLGEVVETALRRELLGAVGAEDGPPIPVFAGRGGPRPGVDLNSTRALQELLDEGDDNDDRP